MQKITKILRELFENRLVAPEFGSTIFITIIIIKVKSKSRKNYNF